MITDDQPPDSNGTTAAKLARLERLLEEQAQMIAQQSARLAQLEQRVGLQARQQTTRPFAQGSAPTPQPTPPEHTSAQHATAPPTPPPFSVTDDTTQTTHNLASPSVTAPDADQTTSANATTEQTTTHTTYTHTTQQTPPASGPSATTAPNPVAAGVSRAWGDLEARIGGSWFNWLGIIAVVVGVSFFLKYAFDQHWIGPLGRVLLGGVAGCAILALAERLRLRGYQAYAYVLSGGGILILYLSVYAAFGFYHLISQPFAFSLMAFVTATAVILAARYDAYAIAVLGLIGGFMTPKLLATNVDNEIGLFGYAALLDAGVLALAYFKRWRSLNYLAFAATWILFAGWWFKFYDDSKLWPTLFFLTLFFVLFAALAIIHNVLQQRPARWFDISLVLTNATFYFATSYTLLDRVSTPNAFTPQAPHALLLSAFFLLLYFIARQKHAADKLLTYTYVASAVTFLTMAVAIQLDQEWVTIGWAVEALMLTWVGLKAHEDAPRFAALPVFAFAVLHWFTVDMPQFGYHVGATFTPILNKRAVSCAVLVGVCAGLAWLYRRYGERVDKDDRDILSSLFILTGNALALALLTLDLIDYFSQALARQLDAGGSLDVLSNSREFALTALWTIYGTVALVVGLLRRLKPLRIAALFMLFAAVCKLLLGDVQYYSEPWHTLGFNQTFLAFALVVGALACCISAYTRADYIAASERRLALAGLLLGANVVALVGLSSEAMGHFNRVKALAWALPDSWHEAARVENNKQLTLTALWTIYASIAFVLGIRRRRAAVRIGALILLALAGAKIMFLDATYYNATWHAPVFNQTFAAFALFVCALWLVAHLYARADEAAATAEAKRVMPIVTVVGNIFALTALSLEASGYFAAQRRAGAVAAGQLRDLRLAQQLALSVLWAIYGGAMLVVGLVRRNRLLRLMALALLGVTTLKVFLFDLSSLDKVYRIISFIVLGAILLAVSFLYQQRQQRATRAEGS